MTRLLPSRLTARCNFAERRLIIHSLEMRFAHFFQKDETILIAKHWK